MLHKREPFIRNKGVGASAFGTGTSLKATSIISLLEQTILPTMASYDSTSAPAPMSAISPEILIGKLLIWRNLEGELNEGVVKEIVKERRGYVIVETMDNLRWVVK